MKCTRTYSTVMQQSRSREERRSSQKQHTCLSHPAPRAELASPTHLARASTCTAGYAVLRHGGRSFPMCTSATPPGNDLAFKRASYVRAGRHVENKGRAHRRTQINRGRLHARTHRAATSSLTEGSTKTRSPANQPAGVPTCPGARARRRTRKMHASYDEAQQMWTTINHEWHLTLPASTAHAPGTRRSTEGRPAP
jgi:hypothetical protein